MDSDSRLFTARTQGASRVTVWLGQGGRTRQPGSAYRFLRTRQLPSLAQISGVLFRCCFRHSTPAKGSICCHTGGRPASTLFADCFPLPPASLLPGRPQLGLRSESEELLHCRPFSRRDTHPQAASRYQRKTQTECLPPRAPAPGEPELLLGWKTQPDLLLQKFSFSWGFSCYQFRRRVWPFLFLARRGYLAP